MKKLLFCFILLTITGLGIRSQEVKVNVKAPESCKTGERCAIEIVIEKQGVEGFARFQQTLPEGLSAELVNDAGSDFIFDKQRVSFIWLSLPPQQIITLSYRIVFNPSLSGSFEITDGTFSYLRDNKIQRQAVSSQRIAINMKEPPVAINKIKSEAKPVLEDTISRKLMQETVISSKVIEKIEVVKKPEADPEVRISTDEKSEKTIQEKAAQKQDAEIPPQKVEVQEKPLLEKTAELSEPDNLPVKVPVAENTALPVKPEIDKTVKQEDKPPAITKSPDISRASSTTEPVRVPSVSGIQYRVQFAALKTLREAEVLKKQFNISEKVFLESDGTWHRYTFGPWNTPAEAEAASKVFISRNGGNAMVVKYQDGKRVP